MSSSDSGDEKSYDSKDSRSCSRGRYEASSEQRRDRRGDRSNYDRRLSLTPPSRRDRARSLSSIESLRKIKRSSRSNSSIDVFSISNSSPESISSRRNSLRNVRRQRLRRNVHIFDSSSSMESDSMNVILPENVELSHRVWARKLNEPWMLVYVNDRRFKKPSKSDISQPRMVNLTPLVLREQDTLAYGNIQQEVGLKAMSVPKGSGSVDSLFGCSKAHSCSPNRVWGDENFTLRHAKSSSANRARLTEQSKRKNDWRLTHGEHFDYVNQFKKKGIYDLSPLDRDNQRHYELKDSEVKINEVTDQCFYDRVDSIGCKEHNQEVRTRKIKNETYFRELQHKDVCDYHQNYRNIQTEKEWNHVANVSKGNMNYLNYSSYRQEPEDFNNQRDYLIPVSAAHSTFNFKSSGFGTQQRIKDDKLRHGRINVGEQQIFQNRGVTNYYIEFPPEMFLRAPPDMFLRAANRNFRGMTKEKESSWKGKFDFICMGDPQIGMRDRQKEEEFSKRAVEFINRRKVKFVIICGDHTHNLEGIWNKGDKKAGRKKRIDQLKAYKDIYSKLDKDIPLVCVCGNHDVGNQPTKETIDLYREEFGDDYFTFWAGGVKFICLNSQLIQGPNEAPDLAKAHEDWFDLEVNKDRPLHLVVCAHIPPFCYDM